MIPQQQMMIEQTPDSWPEVVFKVISEWPLEYQIAFAVILLAVTGLVIYTGIKWKYRR